MDVKTKLALIEGTPLPLGRTVYILPALNLKMMKMFRDDLVLLQTGVGDRTDQEAVEGYGEALVRVTVAALSRNYPDITEDDVREALDFNNMKKTTLAVLGASGFVTSDEDTAVSYATGKPQNVGE